MTKKHTFPSRDMNGTLQLACAIVVDNPCDLVCKCSKAEDICNWCTFASVEAVVVRGVITVIVGD
jgi:hypothetical protein